MNKIFQSLNGIVPVSGKADLIVPLLFTWLNLWAFIRHAQCGHTAGFKQKAFSNKKKENKRIDPQAR